MAENNVDQEIVQTETIQSTEPAKRKLKIGYIFLAMIPIGVLFAIQTITQVPCLILAGIEFYQQASVDPSVASNAADTVMDIYMNKYAFGAFLAYTTIGIVVYGIWYFKGFVKRAPKVTFRQVFGVKSILATIGIAIGLNLIISAGFVIVTQIAPKVIEDYNELMESSGLTGNLLITVIYIVCLGPVVEELCVRALVYGYLEKAGLRPALVILITGIVFGVIHLNIIQGIYASVLGFFLAFLRYKYRSIKITIFAHIIFNLNTLRYNRRVFHIVLFTYNRCYLWT